MFLSFFSIALFANLVYIFSLHKIFLKTILNVLLNLNLVLCYCCITCCYLAKFRNKLFKSFCVWIFSNFYTVQFCSSSMRINRRGNHNKPLKAVNIYLIVDLSKIINFILLLFIWLIFHVMRYRKWFLLFVVHLD